MPLKNPQPRYLGDGVYAKFDGYHIVLTTGSHEDKDSDNRICLEPEVIEEFLKYIQYKKECLGQKP